MTTEIVDAPEPMSSLAAGSEAVALARRATDRNTPDLWTADDTDVEKSFAALVVASGPRPSRQWLAHLEPYVGADTVRTDPVIHFVPHRHFPIGDDEPWADAALSGGRLIAVPLRSVVSYRPDSDVYRRWNDTFKFLAPEPE